MQSVEILGVGAELCLEELRTSSHFVFRQLTEFHVRSVRHRFSQLLHLKAFEGKRVKRAWLARWSDNKHASPTYTINIPALHALWHTLQAGPRKRNANRRPSDKIRDAPLFCK